jgi:hypothetical protein
LIIQLKRGSLVILKMPELDVSRMEEILREDPHFIRIIPAEEWGFPEIDSSMWPEDREEAADSVEGLKGFIKAAYYFDDFKGDHEARRKWRAALELRHPGFYDCYCNNSALRAGKLITVKGEMYNLADGYRGTNELEFQDLRATAIRFCMVDEELYGGLGNDSKAIYMHTVKRFVASTLMFLAEQRPAFSE